MARQHLVVAILAVSMTLLTLQSRAQISTPCSASALSSFTPCLNFVTNSTGNGTSPSQDCCNALKNLTGSSMDCACLIITGAVPFQVPINRTLAISLPRACNMPGVPLQCRASGSPLPAPGPAAFTPTVAPGDSPSITPTGSINPIPISPALSPESDVTPTTPTTDGSSAETPTSTTGNRSSQTPSAAAPSFSLSPSVLLFAIAFIVMKLY